jgi:hypothetical protein
MAGKETGMNSDSVKQALAETPEFQWLSPLGISIILFTLYGAIYTAGVLWPFLRNSDFLSREFVIISNRTDTQLFGQTPAQLMESDAALRQLRRILLDIVVGLLGVAGVFHLAITWFGLRQGQTWALIVLAVGGLAVLPFWFLAHRPYLQAGIAITLGDVPPFMWVPAALLIPATVLGWIGLR